MNIHPGVLGIGAGVAAGVAVGLGATRVTDGIAERHPTGSTADGKVRGVLLSAGGVGLASAIGGMVAMARGNVQLGAGLLGGGFGAMAGAIGAGIAFGHRHGIGVETSVSNIMHAYNRDWDQELDLDTTWRMPEDVRRVENRHEDSDGDVHYTYSYYEIHELAQRADVNHDRKVTPQELRAVFASFDEDGNGRLQGEELRRADREVGEDSWYGGWY